MSMINIYRININFKSHYLQIFREGAKTERGYTLNLGVGGISWKFILGGRKEDLFKDNKPE